MFEIGNWKLGSRNAKRYQTTFQISNFKFLLIFLFLCNFAFAQNYSFDFEEFEKKPYEYVGNFQLQSEFSELSSASNLYKLSFLDKDFWDSYFASVQLKGSYEISKFKLIADLKDKISFTTDNDFENNFAIYESFLNVNPSTNFDFQIGKKSVKWGKGYIWNPVSFVGRQKDINDVDAGLEGFWMLKFAYVKSLSGIVQNFSISPIIIPVGKDINEDFADGEDINFILNNYFLIADTDFDLYLFFENNDFKKWGFDFARNILPSWEIHGEYVFEKDVTKKLLDSELTDDTHDYLLGTRFLFETNTTLIVEYLHNDSGLDEIQMGNFNTQFPMKDYVYAKLSQPEPFDILYFTPSIFVLYNLNDNSEMIGGEFSYSRFENINLKLKYNLMFGDSNSEFGGKISSKKLSLIYEYIF